MYRKPVNSVRKSPVFTVCMEVAGCHTGAIQGALFKVNNRDPNIGLLPCLPLFLTAKLLSCITNLME